MRILIAVLIALAAQLFATLDANAQTRTVLLPFVVQGMSSPVLYAEQHLDNDGQPRCSLIFLDDLGWVEACSYSFDAVTSTDIVRVAFCIHHPPFGSCLLPNADRIEGGLIYWDRIGLYGPQLYTFRTTTAEGETTEYTLDEICQGDCNW